ncbi:MAG: hypothetical protein A3F68_05390 [Acidobacteria bacterium RIFCSPLOWO2_12_FULL_54_10]|nr:MAG: hypothetical protein A3F68_05390 [Acidobacteria bacterium RIFCSPLOWO2_12_FULL_54_10]
MTHKRIGFFSAMGLAVALVVFQTACQQAAETPEQSEAPAAQEPASTASAPKSAPAGSSSTAATAPAAPKERTVTLVAGTQIKVRPTATLSTASQNAGDAFSSVLEEPITEGDWVIAPKGSTLEGKIVEADKGGRVQNVAHLTVALTSIKTASGETLAIATDSITVQAQTTKGKDATKVAIGTGIGAAIGAITGGGKGAGIGAATGAGAGTAVVLATRGDAAEIPAETVLEFKLSEPVTVTEKM